MSYSFSLTTFNPSGKLLQIEYALQTVQKGQTAVGIRAANGVVFAAEKTVKTSLIEADTYEKIATISPNCCMTYAGIGPDFRVLVAGARKHANIYHRVFNENIPVAVLVKEVAKVMQESTQQGGVRPFGCSVILGGMDHKGPQVFQIDPSGSYFEWKATAIGKGFVNAKTFLEKRHHDEMELEDAIHTAILTLKDSFEGEMTNTNVELARVTKEGKVVRFTPAEVQDYLDEAE